MPSFAACNLGVRIFSFNLKPGRSARFSLLSVMSDDDSWDSGSQHSGSGAPGSSADLLCGSQRVAVLLVLGGASPSTLGASARRTLSRKVLSRLSLCGLRLSETSETVALSTACWASETQSAAPSGGGGGECSAACWEDGPAALAEWLAVCRSWVASSSSRNQRHATAVRGALESALAALTAAAGGEAPLVVVALGPASVPALFHIEAMQRAAAAATNTGGSGRTDRGARASGEGGSYRSEAREERISSALERGETIAAVYTLGCPLPLHAATASGASPAASAAGAAAPSVPSIAVPSPALLLRRPQLGEKPPSLRGLDPGLGWTNLYHAGDPLGYPLAPVLPRKAAVQDRLVRLRPVHATAEGRWGGSATYLSRAASRSVASPLAHALVQLWLATNPDVAAALDLSPLHAHREHRSRARGVLTKHAAAASAAAARTRSRLNSVATHYASSLVERSATMGREASVGRKPGAVAVAGAAAGAERVAAGAVSAARLAGSATARSFANMKPRQGKDKV